MAAESRVSSVMADNVDDFDRLPGAAFDHRQEDSPQLTCLPDRDLHLPVFLPNLCLPPPRPEPLLTATPNPWDLAPAPGSFLEPSLLSFSPPRYSPELGGPDELSVAFQSGPLYSDLPDFASFGAQPDSRADGYTSPRAGASPRTSRGSRHRHPPAALPTATHIHDTNEISILNPTAAFTTLPQQSAHNTPAIYETEHLPPLYTPPKMSARKRNSTADVPPSSSPSAPVPKKRRRTSGASQPKSDPLERAESDNESDIIDLRDLSKVPELLLQRQREKAERVKLGSFQCAICMDDATSLTVTHCGHLFCADCLTTALQTEAQRHKCPICRQKIESKPREAYKASTKGYWPLELKLMTTTRKGKKADG